MDQQRKEGSGSDKKKEEFYLRKIKELKSSKDDIEKQMGNQKEHRDQLDMKIEDAKKEIDSVRAKMAADTNEKHRIQEELKRQTVFADTCH